MAIQAMPGAMTDSIRPVSTPIPSTPTTPTVAETTATGGDFRSLLRDAAESLARGESSIDAAVHRLTRGRTLSPEELIALQATVYRHAAEVEMAAKLVDKLTSGVRTLLTSQS